MRQSNDVDDAMNDAVMVVDHQQKRRLFLYMIFVLHIFIYILYWLATTGVFGMPPAYSILPERKFT